MLIDEKGQISAEMILLIGAIFVIVMTVGIYVSGITNDIADSVKDVVDAARESSINRL